MADPSPSCCGQQVIHVNLINLRSSLLEIFCGQLLAPPSLQTMLPREVNVSVHLDRDRLIQDYYGSAHHLGFLFVDLESYLLADFLECVRLFVHVLLHMR